ncbi:MULTISPECIES: TetR/AcrR family transcriptional regulator [Rhizobium]|jgi:AcrR family transcriptional regulator|uniref:TetR/AcrR family transcriptional regulator n=1 Tax=Rhizobium anhuiense TaxID=1184720 RepID=A0A3S0SSK7_9HYPH|nr:MULTISPECIES: TetR/AcrR family transcriptional regulator [Rhizobium]KZS54263.1 TetR family transcriptional regulator [Rhizobium anhuiense bv. trifolii]MBB3296961.1 AcrR family transcriptional regulator [Rhizobium sp. BK112]MBB3366176.1 AcrR family transcriptional regulator [Rhizobium sp. BK077]MBB3741154.1 AcrR family transcriptional regulator [Rhizobium sp. BK591]MBB4176854.1 AcrR family transcriptional regulator [Rhizobium sp. BK109]
MNTATIEHQEKTRGRGRPREFDVEAALDAALRVFSERGYHAASISELTEAMGLAAGSVYKAFGDKRGIFLATFDRYRAVRRGMLDAELAKAETGRDKLHALIAFFAASSHGETGRRGCLVVGSAGDLALFDSEAAERVAAAFMTDETLLADLIRLGQSDGSISADLDISATALALLCLTKGMRVIGKVERSGEEMAAVAEAAMKLVT